MRLRESFVRSRSKLWYELFTRVICTGKNHRFAISYNFYLLWDFHKRTECKRIENIFQTVSCEGCEFKKHDCLHMQWILKVYTNQFLGPQTLVYFIIATGSFRRNYLPFYVWFFIHWFSLAMSTIQLLKR